MKWVKILAVWLVGLPIMVTVLMICQNLQSDRVGGFVGDRVFEASANELASLGRGSGDDSSQVVDTLKDKLLGGLLAAGFDEESCLSRYQSALYRKTSSHKPSS
ncbi:unnamed protein product [Ilex paraguariensis]|uniref:Fucosyltransferase n=1 Tax=Ilex paraguariensis TaxID=185542 RepID=A0ABC8R238_9AQUA